MDFSKVNNPSKLISMKTYYARIKLKLNMRPIENIKFKHFSHKFYLHFSSK